MEKFGLIGEHLGHSYSRFIHNKFGEYEYEYLETDEAGLKDVVMDPAYGGFNVTIPYKLDVMRSCAPDAGCSTRMMIRISSG